MALLPLFSFFVLFLGRLWPPPLGSCLFHVFLFPVFSVRRFFGSVVSALFLVVVARRCGLGGFGFGVFRLRGGGLLLLTGTFGAVGD